MGNSKIEIEEKLPPINMLEKISDYTIVIKERFRSPLFSNFALSWLFINWRIPYLTIFVNEERLGGKTKLEAILGIIENYEYPNGMLWIFPLISALFVVGIYPAIFNWIEIIRLRYQKWLKEIHEKWDSELIPIKSKYQNLLNDKDNFEKEVLKDFKYNLYHFENKLEKLFVGIWTIEIHHEKESVVIFENCHFKNGTFCTNETAIFHINNFQEENKNKNQHYLNAFYSVTVIINKIPLKYNLNLNDRSIFEINWSENRDRKIRFHWKGI